MDTRPFRAIRYNPSYFGRELSNLVCPPYDVISSEEQASLYRLDPRNVVRLELPLDDPLGDPASRYRRAAEQYRQWLADGTLLKEGTPALYAYLAAFSLSGMVYQRRGFIAMMRLEPLERRVVRPHERTLAGPKQDRLELMRASRASFSPIWCLYRGPSAAGGELWGSISQREPDMEATDADGVHHSVWVVTQPAVLRQVRESLLAAPAYIADGHHRYETALRYQGESAEAGEGGPEHAASFAMTYLVDASDPGLLVLGTHRLLPSLPPGIADARSVRNALARWFDLEEREGGGPGLLAAVESTKRGVAFGVWAPALGLNAVARLRGGAVPRELAADRSLAWRRLDLAALHILVIDQLYPHGTAALSETGQLHYTRALAEVEGALGRGEAQMGFVVRQTPVDQIIAVADAGDRMPEKSTYFYPKPVTGLVMGDLRADIPAMV